MNCCVFDRGEESFRLSGTPASILEPPGGTSKDASSLGQRTEAQEAAAQRPGPAAVCLVVFLGEACFTYVLETHPDWESGVATASAPSLTEC